MTSALQQPAVPSPEPDGDAWLITGVRAGDAKAFEQLFFSYYGLMMCVARGYVGARESAEELVQDVMCRLWLRRSEWVVRTTVRAYLCTAVRNAALNEVRHQRIVAQVEEEAVVRVDEFLPGMSTPPLTADTPLLRREMSLLLARALERLSPRMRQAYALRVDHELSYVEVADAMGVTVKSVEKLLERANIVLRRALARHR